MPAYGKAIASTTGSSLRWTILPVADPAAAIAFHNRAFDLRRRFVDPAGEYAELDTGAMTRGLVDRLGVEGEPPSASMQPHGFEVALVVPEAVIQAAWDRAVAAGARVASPLTKRPWGQLVGFLRDHDGVLVELCTPVQPPPPG